MEWIVLKSIFIIITTVQIRGFPAGVCSVYQRTRQGRNRTVWHCCHHFYKMNGVCVECPIGHTSKGKSCKKCEYGKYGHKCAEKCRCISTKRCDHVNGCIPGYAANGSTTHTATISNAGGQTAGNGSSNVVIFMACVAVGGILIVICGTILAKNREAVCRRKPTTIAMENAIRKRKGQTLSFEEENVKEKKESMFAHINEKYMINFDGE
ncbi:uncharacterized protein LOC127714502 isoform X9 [Mytilus californianus]|uniref:uncharacterized protein LOC127714502 isoform X9 n=1 Tax=Mytilus californianus TaxID=6549 RepID=UPI0022453CC9|nr:uncharacterized protein LOC127714502 isoform X9 [Mytilus californianus]